MPPKQKFSKEEVLQAAFQLVRERGIENLNARNIAKMLNSSTQPVFSYYKNMADLKADLFALANECSNGYYFRVKTDENLLVNVGMACIDFAIDEPNLFRMMYLSQNFTGKKLTEFFSFFDDDPDECCGTELENAINNAFDTTKPETMQMLLDVWLYAHGIASMLALNQLPTPRNEIEAMLENMYSKISGNKEREDKK